MIANIASLLLEHYRKHARRLPWRAMPGEDLPDPYRVWLSEVMLQQTTVATVIPRFERFVDRWPTVHALAQASDEDIMSEWAGLGYYARARNLVACARKVAAGGGEFPRDEAQLRQLPGLGAYTAGAIAAIAFGQRAAVVDTNVERVVARLFAVRRPVAAARAELRALADRITPEEGAGDFAQAMMDLGATICRPKYPNCPECPLQAHCRAFASGEPEAFPAPKIRRVRPHRVGVAWWTERDGNVWLVRRPTSGLLGGMAGLPGDAWDAPSLRLPASAIAQVSHGFTHFTLDLIIVECSEPFGEGWFQPLGTISEVGLPTLFRRAVEAVLSHRSNPVAT